jgi:hypothetical protein
MKRIIEFFCCVLIAALGSQAQTSDLVADSTERAKPASGTSNDRIFYNLPNFLTLENADQAPPLSVGEKFKVTARSSFDPVTSLRVAIAGGPSGKEKATPCFSAYVCNRSLQRATQLIFETL